MAVRKEHLRELAKVELQGTDALDRWTYSTLLSVNGAAIILIVPLKEYALLTVLPFIFGIISIFISIHFRQLSSYQSIALSLDSLRSDDEGWTSSRAGDIDWGNKAGKRHAKLKRFEFIFRYLSLGAFLVGCGFYAAL